MSSNIKFSSPNDTSSVSLSDDGCSPVSLDVQKGGSDALAAVDSATRGAGEIGVVIEDGFPGAIFSDSGTRVSSAQ